MENKYAGMTVNERLYVSGLMDEFDQAVAEKDAAKVRSEVDPIFRPERLVNKLCQRWEQSEIR